MKNGIALLTTLLVGVGVPTTRAAAPIGETITLYSVYAAKYVEVQPANGNELAANSGSAITATEQFIVEDAGSGKIRLKSLINNLYVQRTSDVNKLKAVGTSATDAYNQWQWVEGSGGIINLKNVGNNNYVTPNNGGTLKADTGSIGASTEFTWELAGGGAGTWRVIPEDARWPSDDTIVAFCEVTDAEFNLPTNPTNTDCTAAFQAAVDACVAAGGGTVFVPEGQYRLDGPLSVGNNVFLRGRWRELHAGDSGLDLGTVIRCEKVSVPNAVITFAGDGGVYDMTFWHPNQKPASGVTVYPTVIKGGSTHQNVTFLNAYEAIRLPGSSNDRIRGLYGSPLHMGLFSGPAFAVPGFTDINLSPDYLAWSGLETNQAELDAHAAYMYNSGTAMQHDGKAGFFANRYTISGYHCAVRFSNEQQVSNMPQGEFVDADISHCQMGIQFVTSEGVKIKHCSIHDCLDAINTTVGSTVNLNQSTVSGINYDVNANTAIPDVILLNSTTSNNPSKMKLNGGQVIVKDLRAEPARRVYDDYVRKSLKETFFNVKAPQYGALGNSVTDDTDAIVAAVADANANGGGIVFFPAGDYLIKQNLTLSPGVELRGCLGGRVQIQGSSDGSTLRIDVPVGDEFGQAFITMGDYCGIRGMAFYYPNQAGGTTDTFVKHPFTVRGNGVHNYIIACSPINPYRFVEFNGDDSLFMYSYPCAIREVVRSNNNINGRYEDNMGKAAHWPNGTFPCPEPDKEVFIANTVKEGLCIFNLINCDDYNVNSSFWHGCFRGFTIDNSGGDFGSIHFEQCEQYAKFVGGSKYAIMDVGGSQERRWGPVDDPDSFAIQLAEGFTGLVESYDGGVNNEPYEMWDVQSGSLYLRSVGSSHSHGAVLTMRTGVNGSLFLEGATLSDTLIGIENNGSLKMLNCELGGINQPLAEEFGADNTFTTVNVLSDPGQNPIRDYGLVLDRNNIQLVYPDPIKNLTYATTTNGQFNLTVDDPAFLNNSPNDVYLYCEWIVSSGTTVRVSFYGDSGWQVAGTTTFTDNKDIFTRYKLVNTSFGQQGTGYPDIRLEVLAGNSPKIRSFELQTAKWQPVAPKAPTGLTPTGGASVLLDWDDNAEPGVTYNVYRRDTSSGAFSTLVAAGVVASALTDSTAVPGNYYDYVVTAVDSGGRESGISDTVSVGANIPPIILTTMLPDAPINLPYETMLSASGYAPFTWTVIDGSLPSGLTLSTNGVLSGTPGVSGFYDFMVQVEDANGSINTQPLSLAVIQNITLFADDFEDDTPLDTTNTGLGIRSDVDGAGEDVADVGASYSNLSGEYQIRANPEMAGNTSSHALFMNQIGTGIQDPQYIDGLFDNSCPIDGMEVGFDFYNTSLYGTDLSDDDSVRLYLVGTDNAAVNAEIRLDRDGSFFIDGNAVNSASPVTNAWQRFSGTFAATATPGVFDLEWTLENLETSASASGINSVNLNDGAWATNAIDSTMANGIRLYVFDRKNNEDYLAYFDNVRVSVGGVTLDPYDIWVVAHGGEMLIGTPTNDYDGDGMANLAEYALGGNPTNTAEKGEMPSFIFADGVFNYVHPQRSDDDSLVYIVETSTNLVSGIWTNAGYAISGTNVTGATFDYVTNTVPTDLDQIYIRLMMSR